MSYTNGGIHRRKSGDGMVMLFSACADERSILAAPLLSAPPALGVPVLVDTSLLYVGVCDLFRVPKAELDPPLARLDMESVGSVARSVMSALCGSMGTIAISVAEMVPTRERESVAELDPLPTVDQPVPADPSPPPRKRKYTSEDYHFIRDNYNTAPEKIMERYGLRDKTALHHLWSSLRKRHEGKSPAASADDSEGERGAK